ncbi:hypothetical protein ACFXJJ_34075, partial [Streptomyces sp. NPDC059233]
MASAPTNPDRETPVPATPDPAPGRPARTRAAAVMAAALTIGAGLAIRAMTAGDVAKYGGDALYTGRQNGITLATVLNIINGIGAHHGHILIATTNAKAELDPALTRPGRIDKQYE